MSYLFYLFNFNRHSVCGFTNAFSSEYMMQINLGREQFDTNVARTEVELL